jgi:hypothetical protein
MPGQRPQPGQPTASGGGAGATPLAASLPAIAGSRARSAGIDITA